MAYLNCPSCGLTVLPKADWLAVEHCPRCIARRRVHVALLASAAPGGTYASGAALAGSAPGSPSGESAP
jgi:hypothetical protein